MSKSQAKSAGRRSRAKTTKSPVPENRGSPTLVGNSGTRFFHGLTPERILEAVEGEGLRSTGRCLALNSMENRVYDVEVAKYDRPEGPFAPESVVVKFYRPGRWSEETIKEEHRFLNQLSEFEVQVVAPIERDGQTLFRHEASGLMYTVFPKVRGRLKDELNNEEAKIIGRMIGRLHNVGAMNSFTQRPKLDPKVWLSGNAQAVASMPFVDDDLKRSYEFLVNQLEAMITPWFNQLPTQRVHGDFHRGNVLWTNEGAWITDLDDCVTGPRQQDLWLLFPGRDEWSVQMRDLFMEGYHEMARDQAPLSFALIEALRAMRMVHFNGWIAKRWEDPVFPHIFTTFSTRNYWEQAVLDVKEQIGHLTEAGTGFGL